MTTAFIWEPFRKECPWSWYVLVYHTLNLFYISKVPDGDAKDVYVYITQIVKNVYANIHVS